MDTHINAYVDTIGYTYKMHIWIHINHLTYVNPIIYKYKNLYIHKHIHINRYMNLHTYIRKHAHITYTNIHTQ